MLVQGEAEPAGKANSPVLASSQGLGQLCDLDSNAKILSTAIHCAHPFVTGKRALISLHFFQLSFLGVPGGSGKCGSLGWGETSHLIAKKPRECEEGWGPIVTFKVA